MNPWWQEVLTTLRTEFSDITDASQLTQVTIRLMVAGVLGGILGIEREHTGKAAGARTHMLVAMGAAMFVLAPSLAGVDTASLSRVIQGVVAGIGFLCAGTILKGTNPGHVKGLTTAAGLWMTAAIGIAAGMGREATAVLSTLLALGVLTLVPHVAKRIHPPKPGAQQTDDSQR